MKKKDYSYLIAVIIAVVALALILFYMFLPQGVEVGGGVQDGNFREVVADEVVEEVIEPEVAEPEVVDPRDVDLGEVVDEGRDLDSGLEYDLSRD